MKLSDFGLCKPLDCSSLPNLSVNDFALSRNIESSLENDGHPHNSPVRRRTQQEQLLHWQRNRRMLASRAFSVYSFFLSGFFPNSNKSSILLKRPVTIELQINIFQYISTANPSLINVIELCFFLIADNGPENQAINCS